MCPARARHAITHVPVCPALRGTHGARPNGKYVGARYEQEGWQMGATKLDAAERQAATTMTASPTYLGGYAETF